MTPKNKHPQVSRKGKDINIMRNAYISHSKKHEKEKREKIDLLPQTLKKS